MGEILMALAIFCLNVNIPAACQRTVMGCMDQCAGQDPATEGNTIKSCAYKCEIAYSKR